MKYYKDCFHNKISLNDERDSHIQYSHPEMIGQMLKIKQTLLQPDCVIISKTDEKVNLYYKHYVKTPVTSKYLCVVVKLLKDMFIITSYFTDTIKRGKKIWQKKK